MTKTEQLLSNIYVVLSIICFVYVISSILKFIGFLIRRKIDMTGKVQEDFNNLLGDMFRRDELDQIEELAKEKIKTERNNITALLWLMRVAHKRNKSRDTVSYAEDVVNVDASYRDYVKHYVEAADKNN